MMSRAQSAFAVPRPSGAFAVMCLGLMVAGCAQTQTTPQARRGFSPTEYGVAASPRVVEPGQPVPRGGGVYRVGRSYQVRGRTYTPQHDPTHEEVGMASWYGSDFHGRRTANGEIYDMHALSAAHRTLPMPSYVRVTNKSNGRSVVVRVNDRGPFHSNRVIDLSHRAAQILDVRSSGIARVQVTYVGRAPLDGRDDWLVTTVRENGRAVPPQQVAALAPVPDWSRHRPDASAVAAAIADQVAPIPPERPREQAVQVASLGFTAPASAPPPATPVAPAATTATAPLPEVRAALLAGSPSSSGQQTAVAQQTTAAAYAPMPLPRPANGPTTLASAAAATGSAAPGATPANSYVHVGSFRDAATAYRFREALSGHGTTVVDPVNVSGITFYQVRIGPIRDPRLAESALRDARTQGAVTARLTQGS
jgi:rare lipoprotein A